MAGRGRPSRAPERVLEALRRRGSDPELRCVERYEQAENAAREAGQGGCERIVVAGGDGTLNAVLNGLDGADIAVAIVPFGTANVVARELGIPFGLDAACAIAAAGAVRRIDLGEANGCLFALAAGIGFDAAVMRRTSAAAKRLAGRTAILASTLREATRAAPLPYFLTIDGVEREERLFGALVCNTRRYAGGFRLSAVTRPDDGLLDLYLLGGAGRLDLARALLALARNRTDACATVTRMQAREVTCTTAPAQPVQLDGDAFGTTPVAVRVRPGAARMVVAGGQSLRTGE
jgi:YegS/Rv2252/BmrU family lipid kinase